MTEFPNDNVSFMHADIQEPSKLTIHDGDLHRVSVWEAEEDVEEDDQNASNAIDHKACVAHPEGSFGRVLALAQKVRQDGQKVGHRRKYDKAANQSVEACFRA